MRKEQLANIISYLESIKEKDGDYKKYIETLDLLASRLLSYYTPNIQGKYMDITQEEYDELDNLFKDALQKSESFSESKFADEKNEAAREIKNNINEKLHKEFLTDFYADFKQVDINSGKSFYEEMQKNKKVVVQVENEPIIDNQEAIEPKEEKKEEKKEEEKEDEKEISFNQIKSEEIENKIMLEEEKEIKSFKIESDNKKEKTNKIQIPNLNNIKDKLIRHNRTKTENIKNVKIFLPHMNKKNFFLNEQFTEISLKEENNSRNVPSFQLNYDSPKKEFNSFFKSRNNFYNGKNNMTEMNFDIEKRHLSLFQIQPSNVNRINENKINEINIKIIKVEKHIIDLENKTKKQFEQILTQLKTLINNKKFEEKNNIQKINNTYRNDYFCKTFSNININDNYKKPNKKRPKLYVTKKLSLKMSESERKTITSFQSKYDSNKVIEDNNKNNNNKNMLNQMNNVDLINKIEIYLINKFKDK
jgi:hypothetical protein